MSLKFDLDYLWHWLGGWATTIVTGVLLVLVVNVPWWLCAGWVPVWAGIGYLRESIQHIDKEPMFTLHRHIEALAWPVGSACGVATMAVVARYLGSGMG